MKLKLYDSRTSEKNYIEKPDGRKLGLYTCGPTVYNFAHLGNFRTYLAEDLLKRVLLLAGYDLIHVMNITDVDDKIIETAQLKKGPLDAVTAPYTKAFLEDIDKLNILKADHYPEATKYVDHMIAMIETLIKKGHAYKGEDGSIYFSIASFPEYGKLSQLDQANLLTNASQRIENDEYDKDTPADFVLWKSNLPERDGDIFWDSPFGKGRPGWHIECSAMANALLEHPVDIHCGGVDNLFPHHENEIAQSQCCFEGPFVKHWLHVSHLMVNGKKMAKSAQNFYTLRDLLNKGYSAIHIRYLLIQAHYRMPLNFTFEALEAAKNGCQRLQNFVDRISRISEIRNIHYDDSIEKKFMEAILDDLNISKALGILFSWVSEVNGLIDENKVGSEYARRALNFLKTKVDKLLGVLSFEKEAIPTDIIDKVKQRTEARLQKKWKLADIIKKQIEEEGYVLEDSPNGTDIKVSCDDSS